MRRFLCLLCFAAITMTASAQFPLHSYDGSVPVIMNGQPRTAPWAGGMDNPQPAMGDLNNDGKQDMVIFERLPGFPYQFQIKTFINTGVAGNPVYVFQPEYIANFPECSQYLILADYNDDNIPDLFTHGGVWGFAVYKGYYNGSQELCFSFYQYLVYHNDQNSQPPTYAHVKNSDIPCIVDVDGDSDLDFFAYDPDGRYVRFFKNYREEDNLPNDSIRVKFAHRCWGKVRQDIVRAHQLSYPCYNGNLLLRSSGGDRDGNNAICLFDVDGDSDFDLLEGNNQYSDLQFMHNARIETAYPVDSMDTQDTTWKNVLMPQYPAPFYLDADQDGKKDIIVTPLTKSTENHRNMYWLRNTGTTSAPVFTYQKDTFLVDQMIDLGSNAYPVLYDYDRDGKKDLLVGSSGYYQQQSGVMRSRLAYFRNTSTGPGNPSFEFQTYNLLQVDTMDLKGSAPACGDLNNDGKDDLILGQSDGTLTLYINTAGSNSVQPVWSAPQIKIRDINNIVIDVGLDAAPFIRDMDNDGKPDLVIGTSVGYLVYYRNVSTVPNQVKLQRINIKLGDVQVDAQVTWGENYSTPFFGYVDDSGVEYLLCGSASGNLYRYTGFQAGDTSATYTVLDNMYSQVTGLALRTAPTAGDVDGDGKMELIVGTRFGGLLMYRQTVSAAAGNIRGQGADGQLTLHPNPARNSLHVQWNKEFAVTNVEISLLNTLGQLVMTRRIGAATNSVDLDISDLPAGVYFCRVRSGSGQLVQAVSKN
jgi:hypothetical protein